MKLVMLAAVALVVAGAALAGQAAGARPEAGADTALVVIDIQNFYFEKGSLPLTGSVEAAQQARRVLDAFRSRHLPVIHVRHIPKSVRLTDGEPEDAQYKIRPEVQPSAGEKVVTKQFANSFRETDLLEYLRGKAIRRLVIVGMQTHMCVEAASRAAADLGFEVVVLHEACATRPLTFGDRVVPAEMVHATALAAIDGTYGKVVSVDAYLKGM